MCTARTLPPSFTPSPFFLLFSMSFHSSFLSLFLEVLPIDSQTSIIRSVLVCPDLEILMCCSFLLADASNLLMTSTQLSGGLQEHAAVVHNTFHSQAETTEAPISIFISSVQQKLNSVYVCENGEQCVNINVV